MSKAYEKVTETIIAQLEAGEIPWQKPWTGGAIAPKNLSSLKEYRGINALNLLFTSIARGYSSSFFATYKQVSELGGNVRKGEKGMPIVFFRMLEKETSAGDKDEIPFASYSVVFNLDQCENLPTLKKIEEAMPKKIVFNPIEEAEKITSKYRQGIEIEHAGDRACYSPTGDRILMPPRENFKNEHGYYATLFHELGHSTGHAKRLNRPELQKMVAFGSHDYSKEELVAELTSAFLCIDAGISNENLLTNSAAYVQGWLKALRNDKRLLVSAAGQAQKAADLIRGKVGA